MTTYIDKKTFSKPLYQLFCHPPATKYIKQYYFHQKVTALVYVTGFKIHFSSQTHIPPVEHHRRRRSTNTLNKTTKFSRSAFSIEHPANKGSKLLLTKFCQKHFKAFKN